MQPEKRAYFSKRFEVCKNNLKATWNANWYIDKTYANRLYYSVKNRREQ